MNDVNSYCPFGSFIVASAMSPRLLIKFP